MLRVGGEPKKTAGPTLRGAARSRTLQKEPNVCCGSIRAPIVPPGSKLGMSGHGPDELDDTRHAASS